MRIPKRRIWRAFPELDDYEDDDCRRFVAVARRRAPWRRLHALVVIAAFPIVLLGCGAAFVLLAPTVDRMLYGVSRAFEMLVIGTTIAACVVTPSLASLSLRDWFLRRRLRYVLQDKGSCVGCGYSLVGLEVPESLKVQCPECGEVCTVDASLSVLARDGSGAAVIGGRQLVIEQRRFWSEDRRRRWRRIGIVAAALFVFLVLIPAGIYEFSLRAQAAQARRQAPTPADAAALVARHRPNVPQTDRPHAAAIIESMRKRMDAIETQILPEADRNPRKWIGYEVVLDPEADREQDGELRMANKHAAEFARAAIDALEGERFFDEYLVLRDAATQLHLPAGSPADYHQAQMHYLGEARRQARMLSARLLLAVERRDTETAAETLEAILTLGRICREQPFVVAVLVGWAIEQLAADRVKRWLASAPSAEELDAIERLWKPRDPALDVALAIDLDALAQQALIASCFEDVPAMRFAPIFGLAGRAEAVFGKVVKAPGRWAANRDAIEANRAAWAARLPFEPFVARVAPFVPTEPTFESAPLAAILAPALGKIVAICHMRRTEDRVIATLIALERWRVRHGGYPESLDVLVPQFLPSVPIDPWSGKPMGYRRVDPAFDPLRREFHLYSLGPDGVDEGGREYVPTGQRNPGAWADPELTPIGFDHVLNRAKPVRRNEEPGPAAPPKRDDTPPDARPDR